MQAPLMVSLALLFAPAAAASALHRLERATSRLLSHWFGWRSVLATAWLGTPVHEGSHLLACKLLGIRVVSVRLFAPDPQTGTLGSVQFVQTGGGLVRSLRRAVVATAPLTVGTGLLVALWALLLPGLTRPVGPTHMVPRLAELLQLAAQVGRTKPGWTIAAVYATACVATHMAPSRADLTGSYVGLAVLVSGLGAGLGAVTTHWPHTLPAVSGWLAAELFVLGAALSVAVAVHLTARFAAHLADSSQRRRLPARILR